MLNENSCEMKLGFDSRKFFEALAKTCDIEFLNDHSKPSTPSQVMQCSHFIMKSISNTLKECADDPMHLIILSKEFGFDKYLDEDKETKEELNQKNEHEALRDMLDILIKMTKKKHEKKEGCNAS